MNYQNKIKEIDQIQKFDKGITEPFINFITEMEHESQRDYLRLLETLSEK